MNYDNPTWLAIIRSLKNKNHDNIPSTTRAQLIDDAFNLARANYITYFIPFHLSQYLKDELSYVPWMAFFRNIEFLESMIWREWWYEAHFMVRKYNEIAHTTTLCIFISVAFNFTSRGVSTG